MDVLNRLLLTLTVGLGTMLLGACQITYLLKSTYNQVNILYHRVPVEKVLEGSSLTPEEKLKLQVTQRARVFASEKLGLKVGENYSSYVQLKKSYVVWAVNASPKWKLQHYLWHFPIVGSVPYKGFPDEADAVAEAKKLQDQGYDTYIRGVSAYSTLGWFADPILSSMMRYSEENLVNTIIHESVHATIYIESHADFNERLASYLGDKGTELFYLNEEGSSSLHLEKIRKENEDQQLFSQFISEEIKKLGLFYSQSPKENLREREVRFQEIHNRFREVVKPQLKTDLYKNFDKVSLNNARLLLYKTYIEDLSDFHKLFVACKSDFIEFMRRIQTLSTHPNPVEGLKTLY